MAPKLFILAALTGQSSASDGSATCNPPEASEEATLLQGGLRQRQSIKDHAHIISAPVQVVESGGCEGQYEAEDASISGAIEHTRSFAAHGEFTGRSFVDYRGRNGDYVEWTLEDCSGGPATAKFRYALANGNRPLELIVNGNTVEASLAFPGCGAGDWSTYCDVTAEVELVPGTNTIKLLAIGNSGPNMDHLEIRRRQPLATLVWDGGSYTVTEETICLSSAKQMENTFGIPNDQLTGISNVRPGCHVKLFEHSRYCRDTADGEDLCDYYWNSDYGHFHGYANPHIGPGEVEHQVCRTFTGDASIYNQYEVADDLGIVTGLVSGVTVTCGHKYTRLQYGDTTGCPPGTSITTIEECREAHAELGFDFSREWVLDGRTGFPQGCSTREWKYGARWSNLHFNGGGGNQENREPMANRHWDRRNRLLAPICLVHPRIPSGCEGQYEAEDASISGAVEYANVNSAHHQGFTGRSFVNYLNNHDDYVEWTLEDCSGGPATAKFRYALRNGNRPLELIVNGNTVEARLAFPGCGANNWSTYCDVTAEVELVPGTNTIKLLATGSSGANMDHLEIRRH